MARCVGVAIPIWWNYLWNNLPEQDEVQQDINTSSTTATASILKGFWVALESPEVTHTHKSSAEANSSSLSRLPF